MCVSVCVCMCTYVHAIGNTLLNLKLHLEDYYPSKPHHAKLLKMHTGSEKTF